MTTVPSDAQREAGEKWIVDFYRTMETFDLVKFASTFLENDVVFNFTNMPPMKGQESVVAVFGQMSGGLSSMFHELTDVKVLDDRIMAASQLTYKFVNGETTDMRAFAILFKGLEDKKAKEYHIYGDFTPMLTIMASITASKST